MLPAPHRPRGVARPSAVPSPLRASPPQAPRDPEGTGRNEGSAKDREQTGSPSGQGAARPEPRCLPPPLRHKPGPAAGGPSRPGAAASPHLWGAGGAPGPNPRSGPCVPPSPRAHRPPWRPEARKCEQRRPGHGQRPEAEPGLSGSARRSSRPRGRSLRWLRPCEGLRGCSPPPSALVPASLSSLRLCRGKAAAARGSSCFPARRRPRCVLPRERRFLHLPPHPRALYGHLSHQAVFPQLLRPLRAVLQVKIAFRLEGNTAKRI